MKLSVFAAFLAALVAVELGSLERPAFAQVKQGDVITISNATKVRDLVSPGVYYKVVHGMGLKIVPTSQLDWPPPYKEATEKYSQQVVLSRDHRSLLGYVAGLPFPFLDQNDPDIATKIEWNLTFHPTLSDDYDLRYYECHIENTTPNEAPDPYAYTSFGHYAGYSLIGRTEVEPLPVDPDFKTSGRVWLSAIYPELSPAELRGTGIVRYRYADEERGDDQWSYNPKNRRVRRLNESLNTTATGYGAWNPDHYAGFNAKPETYDYKFLGEKQVLASVHAEHVPAITCQTDGGASSCPEAWELRHVYIVEATPRRGIVDALQSKNILYVDTEAWFTPYVDTYDRNGELFQNYLFWSTFRDRPVPDARVAIYPFKRQFIVAAGSTDVQSGAASVCYLPGQETPERETWYINMGSVDKNFFTTQAMRNAADAGGF
jgi:hypothetical protein